MTGTTGTTGDTGDTGMTGATGGDTTPPEMPTSLTPGTPTANEIALTWNAVSDAASYEICVAQTPGGCTPFTVTASPTSASYTATGLDDGLTYYFSVRAKDAAGNTSAATAEVSATTLDVTPPTAPITSGWI